MDLRSQLLNDAPPPRRKGVWRALVEDPRTKQALVLEGDEPLASYRLDVTEGGWLAGERHPDAVVIGTLDDVVWVCFVELKGTLRPSVDDDDQPPSARALTQLEGGVHHFHPTLGSHGAVHHQQWQAGADALDPQPLPRHRVVGVVVAFRHVPRPPPRRPLTVGPTRVDLRVAQISANERNRVTISFREFLERAGIRSPSP